MKLIFILSAVLAASGWTMTAIADDVKSSVVNEAQAFLGRVRDGHLPETAEVILNVDGAQKHLSGEEAGKLLKTCREGVLRRTSIFNRDGSIDRNEKTVETRFACSRNFANYTGSAGVVLFRDEKIVRLIFQVDGYAAAFPRKAK
jgi:hypothetical protein